MESKGLSSQEVTELEDEMKSLSQKLIGNVMIYEILTHGEVRFKLVSTSALL